MANDYSKYNKEQIRAAASRLKIKQYKNNKDDLLALAAEYDGEHPSDPFGNYIPTLDEMKVIMAQRAASRKAAGKPKAKAKAKIKVKTKSKADAKAITKQDGASAGEEPGIGQAGDVSTGCADATTTAPTAQASTKTETLKRKRATPEATISSKRKKKDDSTSHKENPSGVGSAIDSRVLESDADTHMHGTDDETRRSTTNAEKDLTTTKASTGSDGASATQTAAAKTKTTNKKKDKSAARPPQVGQVRIPKKAQKSRIVQPANMITDKGGRASQKLPAEDNHSRPLRETEKTAEDKNDDGSPATPATVQTPDPEVHASAQVGKSTCSTSATEATTRDDELLLGTSSTSSDPAGRKKNPTAVPFPELEEDGDDEDSDSEESQSLHPRTEPIMGGQKKKPPRGVGTHVVLRYPSGTSPEVPEEFLNSKERMERKRILEAMARDEAKARGEEYKPPVVKKEWDMYEVFGNLNNVADIESDNDG